MLKASNLIGQYSASWALIGWPTRESRGTYYFMKKQRMSKIGLTFTVSVRVHVFLPVMLYSYICLANKPILTQIP